MMERPSFECGCDPAEFRFESVGEGSAAVLCNDGKRIAASYEDVLEHYHNMNKLSSWADMWEPIRLNCLDWQKPWAPTIHKAAKGTALIIAPWNYPLILSLQPLHGAISAECCAVVKPSEIAPHYAQLLSELLPKYLDGNAYRVILGGPEETTHLLELQLRIGRIVSAAATKHLTPLTLELGGKSPVTVDPSFDIPLAAKRTLWAKAQNCGQLCVSPDYVYAFIDALKVAYAELFPECSIKSNSISRIVNPAHHARLMDLSKRSQGKVVMGGGTEGTTKIELTVVKDVLANDSLMEGEIFGPFLPIVAVNTVEDAIEFVRNHDHPLSLYVFTESEEVKKQVLAETLSGSVAFNDLIQQLAVSELPFGGVGDSGHGRQGLRYTFDTFSYERGAIDVPQAVEPFNAVRYQPYDEEKFKALTAAAFLPIPSSA
ncbi:aldehyde dehydrogenase [Mycena galericulata]|nr:aldehyde dehydrogenase [Mycena galericulata]